ncbi:MAG: MotA/TolQ/ExbB proton channel family protein [Bacteroidales bacterium]|nr:MotA/TolQ/ExbB proton channel family protein [Bacteroidales bacterium]
MKKVLAIFAILGLLFIGVNTYAQAPDSVNADTTTAVANDSTAVDLQTNQDDIETVAADEEIGIHDIIKSKFIEGGAGFMGIILISMILGLAISLERVIYLTLASSDAKKLLNKVEAALENDGIEGAKEVCRNTRGPVASIFYQGLDRYDQGIEVVEKSVITYGSVQMGLLERGLTWISLFIAVAPMLGFMGTVIGMIGAFDAIEKAGDISPSLVAGGIKQALLTTVFGLIVAIILQIFYNYITSKIDAIVTKMEDSSVSLIDLIYKFNLKNK